YPYPAGNPLVTPRTRTILLGKVERICPGHPFGTQVFQKRNIRALYQSCTFWGKRSRPGNGGLALFWTPAPSIILGVNRYLGRIAQCARPDLSREKSLPING